MQNIFIEATEFIIFETHCRENWTKWTSRSGPNCCAMNVCPNYTWVYPSYRKSKLDPFWLIPSCYSEPIPNITWKTIQGFHVVSGVTFIRHPLSTSAHIFFSGEFQDLLRKSSSETCQFLRALNPFPSLLNEAATTWNTAACSTENRSQKHLKSNVFICAIP